MIEAFGAFILSLIFMLEMSIGDAIWAGIFHFISAFNNAGFSIFEVTSAIATVDVSAGDGGVLSLSALFSDSGKLLIIVLMLCGKVGILLFSVAIFMNKQCSHIKYLEDKILI